MDAVPNAITGRDNIEIEIYGMEGIPEKDAEARRQSVETSGADGAPEGSGTSTPQQYPPQVLPHQPAMGMHPAAMMRQPHPAVPMVPGMRPGMVPMPGGMVPVTGVMPVMMQPPIARVPMVAAPSVPLLPRVGLVPNPARPLFPAAINVAPLQNPQIPGAPLLPTPGAPVVSAPTSTVQPPTLPEAPLSEQTKPQPQQATASSSSTTSVPVKVPPPAANSRIIHPEDNLSLEELLLESPKYKSKCQPTGPANSGLPGGVLQQLAAASAGSIGAPIGLQLRPGLGLPVGAPQSLSASQAHYGGGATSYMAPPRPLTRPPGTVPPGFNRPPAFEQGPVRY